MPKTKEGLRYQDFQDGDYTYRRYAGRDKAIMIIASPRGGAGTAVYEDTHPAAWRAINSRIDEIQAGRRSTVTAAAVQAALSILLATLEATKRPARKRRQLPPAEVPTSPPPPESAPIPWGWIGGGVAFIAGLAFVFSPQR